MRDREGEVSSSLMLGPRIRGRKHWRGMGFVDGYDYDTHNAYGVPFVSKNRSCYFHAGCSMSEECTCADHGMYIIATREMFSPKAIKFTPNGPWPWNVSCVVSHP